MSSITILLRCEAATQGENASFGHVRPGRVRPNTGGSASLLHCEVARVLLELDAHVLPPAHEFEGARPRRMAGELLLPLADGGGADNAPRVERQVVKKRGEWLLEE